jgi:AcrR family transcriptional regulator
MKRPTKQDPPTAERIIDAASPLFYRRGLSAVTLDDIAAAAEVTKRTLYYHFPTKDDLVLAYLERWRRRTKAGLVGGADGRGAARVLEAFRQLERDVSNRHFRGCPIVNAVAEINDRAHPATALGRAYKEDRRAWFESLVRSAGIAPAAKLSEQLMTLWEGAMVRALISGNSGSVREACEAASALLERTPAKRRGARPPAR